MASVLCSTAFCERGLNGVQVPPEGGSTEAELEAEVERTEIVRRAMRVDAVPDVLFDAMEAVPGVGMDARVEYTEGRVKLGVERPTVEAEGVPSMVDKDERCFRP